MMTEHICDIFSAEISPLKDPELFRSWMDRMPEERKRKILSLRPAESQRQSLGVGILLFRAMEQYGLEPERREIRAEKLGKPYLPDAPAFQFNLSHSGERVLCAVSDRPVGCDVERIERNLTGLARRFFHPEEQAALAAVPEEERNALFVRLWTRKESYLKAKGTGISESLSGFSAVSPPRGVWYAEGPEIPGYVQSCCVIREEEPFFRWQEVSLTGEPA